MTHTEMKLTTKQFKAMLTGIVNGCNLLIASVKIMH